MIGGGLVKHWAKTQSTIALSSGEAELGGICAGAAQGLGLQSLAADMGWKLQLRLHSDATAAIGISKRRGLGKIRHLHTSDLWIQDALKAEKLELVKVPGADNPADALTKYLDQQILRKALATMNLEYRDGRAAAALQAAGVTQDANNSPSAVDDKCVDSDSKHSSTAC